MNDFSSMKSSKTSHTPPLRRKKNIHQKSIQKHYKKRRWAILSLLLCTFLVYLPSLQNGFVNWDDNTYVYENKALINMDIDKMVTDPMADNYHPLTMLSLAVNYAIGGLEPFGYHAFNLLLHLINSLLVFLLLYNMTKRNIFIPFIAALIFGIHPMHIESVAWVSERKDLLYTLFFLSALLTYIQYIKTKQALFYGLTFGFFILSLLSKPAAVILPLVLLLFDLWYGRKHIPHLLLEKIPFFLGAIALGVYTMQIQDKAILSVKRYSILHRLLFAGYGFVFYIFKFFIPYPSLPFHAHPIAENSLPIIYWIAPILSIGVLASVFLIWRRNKVMVFGILFYLLNLLLVLQIITVGGAVVSERYTYVPYISLAFILAYGCRRLMAQFSDYQKIIQGVLIFWLLAIGAYTFQHQKIWKNGKTLWTYQITQVPKEPRGLINLGTWYIDNFKKNRKDRASLDKSLQLFDKALKINPNHAYGLNERAGVYFELQDRERGFKDINRLIQVSPNFYRAYLNRAILYSISNDHALAIPDYTRYLESRSKDHKAYNWRGISYLQLQNWNQALLDFTTAIQIKPNVGEYYFQRSNAHYNLGNEAATQRDRKKAQQLGFKIPKS